MQATAEPSSWSELCNGYLNERNKSVPLDSSQYSSQRKYRDSRFNKLGSQREYDVVRHRYRDETKEETFRKTEEKHKITCINRAKDFVAKFENRWDIISHKQRVPTEEPPRRPRKNLSLTSAVKYNIISNEDTRGSAPFVKAGKASLASQVEGREFDIVSNKYFKRHSSRSKVCIRGSNGGR